MSTLGCALLILCGTVNSSDDEQGNSSIPSGVEKFSSPSDLDETLVTLRHGISPSRPPFEYIDDFGTYSGLTSDYVRILSEALNLRFEQIVFPTPEAASNAITRGEIDIATYDHEERDQIWQADHSIKIAEIPIVLLAKDDVVVEHALISLGSKRVAVQALSQAAQILTKDFSKTNPQLVQDGPAGLLAVSNGEADLFMHNTLAARYYMNRLGIKNVKIVAVTPYNYSFSITVSAKHAGLLPQIKAVLEGMGQTRKNQIFDRWADVQAKETIDWKPYLIWGGVFLLFVILVISLILWWNHRLALEVALRTKKLRDSTEQLRTLARHLTEVREEEKKRLSREIHDELGHTLTAMNISLQQIAMGLPKEQLELGSRLDEVSVLLREAKQISRRIMSDLRPSVLEDLGLVAALEWLSDEYQRHTQIHCTFYANGFDEALSEDIAIALFRIVQESLTNAARHSGATATWVELDIVENCIQLTIADNGRGLTQEEIRRHTELSLGLQGMQERALAIGGSFSVVREESNRQYSNEHVGLCLRVIVPLP